MTQVLIVDDHPIVLQGCRRILQDMGIIAISGATSIKSGYRAYLRLRPDLVVTDLSFEGDDLGGLTLIQRMHKKNPEAHILVFSMHDDPTIVSRALANGATAYVLKDAASSDFMQAVESMQVGRPYLNHELAVKVAMLRAKSERSTFGALTERETQILALLGQGHSNDKIATRLGISVKTVTNAIALIRTKLKLGSFAELLHFAMQNRSDLLTQ